ncbi:nudix hydrolase 22, chloroplastic [Geobacter sp. OR-1]|nr:nudix hydrolase 22, chloroplastic [Geobacter sp. OR-1]
MLPPGPVPAAVLVPVFLKEGDFHLLFTKRSEHLNHHAGEISFPGGVCNPEEHPRDAALRETWEEIGIEPAQVDILGPLDDVYSIHHYNVTPFIGFISDKFQLKLNSSEIDKIIDVPIKHLLNPFFFRIEEWGWQGRNYPVYFYSYNGDDIWGMTAEIVMNFLDVAFERGPQNSQCQ